jgi:hypothetical protein
MADEPVPSLPEDIVTSLTTAILRQAGPDAYGRLVISGKDPLASVQSLHGVALEKFFSRPIKHEDDAQAAIAGLWLWVDDLEESHKIAQEIVSTTGSLWHAILHRREGDFSNAKYWYRRCDTHPVNKMMGAIASSLAGDLISDRGVAHAIGGSWNPLGFVDLVEAVYRTPADPGHQVAVRLQRAEWDALFTYCVRQAVEADTNDLDDWDRRVARSPSGG